MKEPELTKRWIAAGKILAADPTAKFPCPVCNQADLVVTDVGVEGTRKFERNYEVPKLRCSEHPIDELGGLVPQRRQRSNRTLFAFVAWPAVLGISLATLLEAMWWAYNSGWIKAQRFTLERLTLVLWPTSLPFLVGPSWTPVNFLISALCNAFLYAAVGAMCWFALTKYKAFLVVPILLVAGLWTWLWWLFSF